MLFIYLQPAIDKVTELLISVQYLLYSYSDV